MARRKLPDEVYTHFLGEPHPERDDSGTIAGQTTHEQHTTAGQKGDVSGTTEAMERYDVRFSAQDWEELGQVAKQEGSSRSVVLRRLVREFLQSRRRR